MKTVIKSFETPNALVNFSKITLDTNKRTFSLTLKTKEQGQRKFREEKIEGTITNELNDYFTLLKDVKVPVKTEDDKVIWVPTGRKLTNFQRFLAKTDREISIKIEDMVFECNNTSETYQDNPFRLVMLDQKNILTLVTTPSKSKKQVVQADGTVKTFYRRKQGVYQGKKVNAFISPKNYRRLIIQTEKEVEVAAVEGYTPNPLLLNQ